MPASPSSSLLPQGDADTVTLHTKVFYDPNLFHYISSGWDLSELLTQRVRTSTSIFAPLSLTIAANLATCDTNSKVCQHSVGASQLRREALRALLIGPVAADEEEENRNTSTLAEKQGSAANEERADSSLESAVDRWMQFTHLYVHGGKKPASAEENKPTSLSPAQQAASIVIVDDAKHNEPAVAAEASKATATPPSGSTRVSDWPVIAPIHHNGSVVLVLSLVKDAQTWRKMRRDARLAANAAVAANAETGTELQDSAKTATQPSLFVSDDDALFTQWLQSKRALRQQWRQQHGNAQINHERSHGEVPRSDTEKGSELDKAVTGVQSQGSSSTSSSDEDDHVPHTQTTPAVDAEARRAAVLAAVERRRTHT